MRQKADTELKKWSRDPMTFEEPYNELEYKGNTEITGLRTITNLYILRTSCTKDYRYSGM